MRKRKTVHSNDKLKLIIGIVGIAVLIGAIFLVRAMLAPAGAERVPADGIAADMEGGAQVIRMSVESYYYEPAAFTVKQGIPVRWVIDGTRASGCTQYVIAREFGISKRIMPGENIVEFTPTKKGSFPFSCSMNMARGTITVV